MPALRPFSFSFGQLCDGLTRGIYTLASGALLPDPASDLDTWTAPISFWACLLQPCPLPHHRAYYRHPHLASFSCTDSRVKLQLWKLPQAPPRPTDIGASALTPSLSSLLRTGGSGVCIPLPLPAWEPPDQPLHQPPSPTSHLTPSVPPACSAPSGQLPHLPHCSPHHSLLQTALRRPPAEP